LWRDSRRAGAPALILTLCAMLDDCLPLVRRKRAIAADEFRNIGLGVI
jgi:hypothetical protein